MIAILTLRRGFKSGLFALCNNSSFKSIFKSAAWSASRGFSSKHKRPYIHYRTEGLAKRGYFLLESSLSSAIEPNPSYRAISEIRETLSSAGSSDMTTYARSSGSVINCLPSCFAKSLMPYKCIPTFDLSAKTDTNQSLSHNF
jgi:hypothetical protein